MRLKRYIGCAVRLATLLAGVGATALLASPTSATAGTTATVPAQYPGYPWGGAPGWPPGSSSPSWTSPYAGSPGYPYYRRGAYYGSAYGLPYPRSANPGAYSSDTYGPAYPFYPSAGGVAFGYGDDAGFFTPQARCLYSAIAGIGGSWYDPPTYGYYAPSC
jgi:hypothetical protein